VSLLRRGLAGVVGNPTLAAVLGALVIAFSAVLVDLSNVAPASAAFFRCAFALPFLGALAWWEDRRFGRRSWNQRRLAFAAGLLFAVDLIAWHHAIEDVGAGLATVLGNLQVVIVPFVALLVLGERVPRRILVVLPLVFAGVVLVSGVLDSGAYGLNPARGVAYGVFTGVAYSAFLLVQRQGSLDLRRPGGPLFDMTLVAALGSLVVGIPLGEIDLTPSWAATGWLVLLATTSQVLGWLLITLSLPRLPAAATSLILTIQPIGSVILGAILVSQDPSALQIAGVACILAGLVGVAVGATRSTATAARAAPAPGAAGS
jgi:drug/metabolite transporter (DMT)-like permease